MKTAFYSSFWDNHINFCATKIIPAQRKPDKIYFIEGRGGGGSVCKILCLNYHSGYKWPRWGHLINILSSLKFQFFSTSESIKLRILRTWRITRSIKNINLSCNCSSLADRRYNRIRENPTVHC